MNYFVHLIRKFRIEKELTQEYMAQQLSMSVSSYSKLERGQVEITLHRAEQLAHLLGFDLSEYHRVQEEVVDSLYRAVSRKEWLDLQQQVEELAKRVEVLEKKM